MKIISLHWRGDTNDVWVRCECGREFKHDRNERVVKCVICDASGILWRLMKEARL